MKLRYFSYDDRKRFEALYQSGASPKALAQTFEVNLATVYREIERGSSGEGEIELDANGRVKYSAERAQAAFVNALKNRGKNKNKK